MNILSIEKARTELLSFLENASSRRLRAKRISEFFALLIEQKPFSLAESYLLEFLPKYLDHLKSYSSFGVEPNFSQNILSTNEKLINLIVPTEFKDQLISSNEKIQKNSETLFDILNGNEKAQYLERKVLFPVIEDNERGDEQLALGAIDSLTIKITRAKDRDKFIVVPSEVEKDKQFAEQIHTCWLKAKDYCKKYVKKIAEYHEVIISFDGNLGIYRGESLGAALIIGFVEELLKHYNSLTVLKPIIGTAFTGGISESGKVQKVSKEIVEKKVEIAFYSNCQTLAVPKEDETFALYKLDELFKLYPKRNFRIVGVSTLEEILLRRDLVEIKKQKLIVRTGKFVKKNWVSAVVTVLLAVLFGYLFVMDWDDNPTLLTTDGGVLYVKNKNGKILWTKKAAGLFKNASTNKRILDINSRIFDVDSDGKNEVLFSGGLVFGNKIISQKSFCFDYKGNTQWIKSFTDEVESERDRHDPNYHSVIIDTFTNAGRKSLFLICTNANSFSSAIYRIDLETGARLPGTMWCSGFVVDAIIKDIDNDGKEDILAVGVDNGFEEIVIFSYEIDTLTRVRFSTKEYLIRNFPTAELKNYIRLPKTDYDNYLQMRIPAVERGTLDDKFSEKKYMFATTTNDEETMCHLWIKLDYNLKDFDVIVDNRYRVIRDSLVAKGKLNPPYTDTKEWIESYKSKILYWKNGKWVKREELE